MDPGSSSRTPSTPSKRLSSSPIPSSTSPFTTSSGFGERRRKRSNTISGPHPLEVPITQSDHQLASLIDRLNIHNSRTAAAEAAAAAPPAHSIPQVLLPLTYQRGSTESCEAGDGNDLEEEKTPTQEDFALNRPPLRSNSPVEEDKPSKHLRGRSSSYSCSARSLSPIADDYSGGAKTPTRLLPLPGLYITRRRPAKAFNDETGTAQAFYADKTARSVESAAFPPFDPDFRFAETVQPEKYLTKGAGVEASTSEGSTSKESLADKVSL